MSNCAAVRSLKRDSNIQPAFAWMIFISLSPFLRCFFELRLVTNCFCIAVIPHQWFNMHRPSFRALISKKNLRNGVFSIVLITAVNPLRECFRSDDGEPNAFMERLHTCESSLREVLSKFVYQLSRQGLAHLNFRPEQRPARSKSFATAELLLELKFLNCWKQQIIKQRKKILK